MDPNPVVGRHASRHSVFQFPSNGKVDPNLLEGVYTVTSVESFNSLQTGKWILTYEGAAVHPQPTVFQFPSNGKVDPNKCSQEFSSRS